MDIIGHLGASILRGLYLLILTSIIYTMDDTSKAKVISPFIFIIISFIVFPLSFALFCSGFFLSAGLGYRSHAMNRIFESQTTIAFRLFINILSTILTISGLVVWLFF